MNLILIRHGQSEWNALNQFTGWENPGLTKKGVDEATKAGLTIKSLGIKFDLIFSSALVRAQKTGEIILTEINQRHLKIIKNKALNERFYGDLQGMNKDDCKERWGEEQVQIWRRSFDKGPPGGETLKETGERVLPFFMKEILPHVCEGKNVLVAAHGNSLRSLIKFLDNISDEDIVKLEIPTGAPIHYVINEDGSVKSKQDFFNE